MADWEDVTDVGELRAMLAAQQVQLQKLQAKKSTTTAGVERPTKKRKASTVHADYERLDSDDEEQSDGADTEGYDSADDSDYDAPKKPNKKKMSSTSKSKKGRRAAVDRDTDSDEDDVPAANSAQVAKAAAAALRSIKSTITAQMVYKPSIKHGSGRVSVELPCLSMAVISHMLGPDLMAQASNGKKQLQLKANDDDLDEMFQGGSFSKSLRYGSTLGLEQGLTFTYNKDTETLKAHGKYKMFK